MEANAPWLTNLWHQPCKPIINRSQITKTTIIAFIWIHYRTGSFSCRCYFTGKHFENIFLKIFLLFSYNCSPLSLTVINANFVVLLISLTAVIFTWNTTYVNITWPYKCRSKCTRCSDPVIPCNRVIFKQSRIDTKIFRHYSSNLLARFASYPWWIAQNTAAPLSSSTPEHAGPILESSW